MTQKLTARQLEQLEHLYHLPKGRAWAVGGHNRVACHRLVEFGLAIDAGATPDPLARAFTITDAGRARQEEEEGLS